MIRAFLYLQVFFRFAIIHNRKGGVSLKKRFYLIDAIRGFALINMVLFHFLFDVFVVFGRDPYWDFRPWVHLWQQFICWTFIFISGFSWSWGRKHAVKRGLLLNFWGFVITAVTVIWFPEEGIWFGILNFMGCAVLILYCLRKLLIKVKPIFGLILCFYLFVLCIGVPDGYFGFRFVIPEIFYKIKLLTPFGFPFPGFTSGDYFPMIPWIFLYFSGFYTEKIVANTERVQRMISFHIPVLSEIGQHTLFVYLLHQPICYAICYFLL